jgi:hypothetical protein
MSDTPTHSSSLDASTVAELRADLRKSASALLRDAQLDDLLHRVSDNLHGVFLSLQDAMGQDDGGVADLFMSGDEERLIVRTVAQAVLSANWDGEALPGPWDGTSVKEVLNFHPRDPDVDGVREQLERAVIEFLNDFAASADVDEDKVERVAALTLVDAMERYVAFEALYSGAMPPMPGMAEVEGSDGTVFHNEASNVSVRVETEGGVPFYTLFAPGEHGAVKPLFMTADLDEAKGAYADRWIAAVAVSVGIGFNPDTPAADYAPPLERSLAVEYPAMIELAHEFGSDPYAVGIAAWEEAGLKERDGPTP